MVRFVKVIKKSIFFISLFIPKIDLWSFVVKNGQKWSFVVKNGQKKYKKWSKMVKKSINFRYLCSIDPYC